MTETIIIMGANRYKYIPQKNNPNKEEKTGSSITYYVPTSELLERDTVGYEVFKASLAYEFYEENDLGMQKYPIMCEANMITRIEYGNAVTKPNKILVNHGYIGETSPKGSAAK